MSKRSSSTAAAAATTNHDHDSQSTFIETITSPSGGGGSPSHYHNHHQENSIDKFTHFALNSHTIPLGSMQEETWLDILDAVDAWLGIGGGFAADSAERLLERLLNEHAASFSQKKSNLASSYIERSIILIDLQRDVSNSWIHAFHLSEGNSQLALSRAEQAMFRLLDLSVRFDKTIMHLPFPLEEYIAIVEGYLNSHAPLQQGPEKAGHLLLRLISDDNDKRNLDIADHATQIGSLFENCATQLLTIDSKSALITELLEIMTVLKESGICPEMNFPDVTERIRLESTLQRTENADVPGMNTMSPFELEVAEKRLIDLLKNANEQEKDTIQDLVQKLTTTKPRIDLIVALLEYYIRVGDVESASHWLQKLEPSFLISSFSLVERVLESWLAQTGSRVPWRADEVFKTVARKIQQHDENFLMSTKSFNLIVDIWTSSEDQSASRKILDWYAQMTSWMVKPDGATLNMTLQALRKLSIDNPLKLVSIELLQQWDDFSKDDKLEIANAVLEVISFKRENINTVTKFIDRFHADNIIPAKSLFQSSLSAIQMDHASPSDVMAIVHSVDDNATEDIDLSLYNLAIDTLFKLNEDASPEIQSLYDHVLKLMTMNRGIIDPNDISEFLYAVIAMHVNRKLYSEAGSCLKKAENVLLSTTETTDNHYPIPLKCYKKMIIRKWYTAKTAQKVEESFEHLMNLYRAGYSNLQPDCDLYTAYINARASAGKEVEHNLEEMIELYQSSENEALMPQTKVFNTVLLSLAQDKRKSSNLHNKSINILNRMVNLGVQPDIKTINMVLKNVIKGNNKNAYRITTMLIQRMEKNELNPDSHTLHLILDACGSASPDERESAIKNCLSTFGEIRKQSLVGPITYGILSKVVYRLVSRDVRADKIGESVLALCCEDGMLTSEVRGRLQSMMSLSAWAKQYESGLSHDERQLADWSRNIHTNDNSSSKDESSASAKTIN